jgi:hypothetical protein
METKTEKPISFLHQVGPSTLKQGITIPLSCQNGWLKKISKGEKIEIPVRLSESVSKATIRRINNNAGHLQIRYENKDGKPIREYIENNFMAPKGYVIKNGLIEVTITPDSHIEISIKNRSCNPRLFINPPILHNIPKPEFIQMSEYNNLKNCISQIDFQKQFNQIDYNFKISEALLNAGWKKEVKVVDELGLKCDFENNGVCVEVEFGNARTYYQDYIKFMLAEKYRQSRCGILICPVDSFAHYLCEIGRKRSEQKRMTAPQSLSYSGMMSYEKAVRELPYIGSIFHGRIAIAGIDVSQGNVNSIAD